MTVKEFFLDYQPWITLIYLIILASPTAVARLIAAPRLRVGSDPGTS